MLAVVIIAGLILGDLRFNRLDATRSVFDTIATPVYWLANIPGSLLSWGETNLQSRSNLLEDNDRLQRENLVLQGRSQQMASLQAENVRLRSLLNSSALLRNDVLVAELIGVSPDPVRHQVILNKGANDKIFFGQPLIDADGLMGQVVQVDPYSSRVLLITDATHAIPVQVNRNGVRAIAEGIGRLDQMELRHVAITTDIAEGDLLVSSGFGQRFPAGYPVAIVTKVLRDPGQPFATVRARPSAALNRSRHVLLVFTRDDS